MVDCISWLLIPSGCDTSRSLLIAVLLVGGELEHHWGKEGPGGKPVRWERNLKLLSLVDQVHDQQGQRSLQGKGPY